MNILEKMIEKIKKFVNDSPAEGCEINYLEIASKLFELYLKANTIAEENKIDANIKLEEMSKLVDSLVEE